MRRDAIQSVVAVLAFSLLLGLAYPLVMTGASQVLFPGKAAGSKVEVDGRVVGSELIGQDFKGLPRYFQSRPSVTGYDPSVTFFNNLGPNNRELMQLFRDNARAYLALERPYNADLTIGDIPPDAVQTSASGVDPHISEANASIQAARVAEVRGISEERVLELVDDNTDGRFAALLGEPGVNVLELNVALDEAGGR